MDNVHGPLEGYTVIDCTSYLAGPGASKILADLGARTIKIEPVSGDPARVFAKLFGPDCPLENNVMLETVHGNKENISLNLKTKEGLEILYKMVSKADVFVTNYVLGALERLHITYEELNRINPRLVYGYVNGLGEKGADAGRPSYDVTSYWSRGGFFSHLGEPGAEPLGIISGMGDNPTSVCLAAGIMAALIGRERTGKGDKVDAALYHTAIWVLNMELCASNYVNVERSSRKLPKNALINTYRCADGKWLTVATSSMNTMRDFKALCEASGQTNLLQDPRFCDMKVMYLNRGELVKELEKVFAQYDREKWEKILDENHICYEDVQSLQDILKDPQALENEFLVPVTERDGSVGMVPTIPIKLQSTETNASKNLAERQGESTVAIMEELGYSNDEIMKLAEEKTIVI